MILLKKLQRNREYRVYSSCVSWLILFALVLTLASCASLKTLIQNSPYAVTVEPVYNFEFAGPEQEITHTFKIKNTGNLPLLIETVSPECGCTVTSVPDEKISPESHGDVSIKCETMRYEGDFKKHFTLYTNDPENSEIVLTIKGAIKRYAMVIPQGISFGEIVMGENLKRSVRLLQLSENKLNLRKVEANEDYFKIKTSWFNEENKKGYDIDVALKSDVPPGKLNEVITLHTNLRNRPRIDVMVWADVKE